MSQLVHGVAGKFPANHPLPAIKVGLVLTLIALVVASAVSSKESAALASSIRASPPQPKGFSEGQVAQDYGRIDHSFLRDLPDEIEPNQVGASIAAYDTPPQ